MSDEYGHDWAVPVNDAYIAAVGRAAYNFAYLEVSVCWLGEFMSRGFFKKRENRTAKQIAGEFKKLAAAWPDTAYEKRRIDALAALFDDLAIERNSLLHGGPVTHEGQQILQYGGRSGTRVWTIEEVYDFAHRIDQAASEANGLNSGSIREAWYAEDQGIRKESGAT